MGCGAAIASEHYLYITTLLRGSIDSHAWKNQPIRRDFFHRAHLLCDDQIASALREGTGLLLCELDGLLLGLRPELDEGACPEMTIKQDLIGRHTSPLVLEYTAGVSSVCM